jgi:hypothetical protein
MPGSSEGTGGLPVWNVLACDTGDKQVVPRGDVTIGAPQDADLNSIWAGETRERTQKAIHSQ